MLLCQAAAGRWPVWLVVAAHKGRTLDQPSAHLFVSHQPGSGDEANAVRNLDGECTASSGTMSLAGECASSGSESARTTVVSCSRPGRSCAVHNGQRSGAWTVVMPSSPMCGMARWREGRWG